MEPVDFAVSYSSWEHDGLGRYGDPIDPWGDISALQRAACYVKPGTLLHINTCWCPMIFTQPASHIECRRPCAASTWSPEPNMFVLGCCRSASTEHIFNVANGWHLAPERCVPHAAAGGLMFFAAPVSHVDQLMYNAHRIYGAVRFPLLTADWEVLGVYQAGHMGNVCGIGTCTGLWDYWAKQAPPGAPVWQPLVVMQNMRTTPCLSNPL